MPRQARPWISASAYSPRHQAPDISAEPMRSASPAPQPTSSSCSATYDNGVLTIALSKNEAQERATRIEIQARAGQDGSRGAQSTMEQGEAASGSRGTGNVSSQGCSRSEVRSVRRAPPRLFRRARLMPAARWIAAADRFFGGVAWVWRPPPSFGHMAKAAGSSCLLDFSHRRDRAF